MLIYSYVLPKNYLKNVLIHLCFFYYVPNVCVPITESAELLCADLWNQRADYTGLHCVLPPKHAHALVPCCTCECAISWK